MNIISFCFDTFCMYIDLYIINNFTCRFSNFILDGIVSRIFPMVYHIYAIEEIMLEKGYPFLT